MLNRTVDFQIVFTFFIALTLGGCAVHRNSIVKQQTLTTVSKLKYINTYVFPHDQQFRGTTIGGLSGIDYDPASQLYYLICDDRSTINPARFYTAKIALSASGISDVTFKDVKTLKQQDGSSYPKLKVHATHTTDPEAMRYNGLTQQLYWTSEGERLIKNGDTTLIDPTITIVSVNGKYTDSIPLPDNLRMHGTESGPRRNGVLEGLTFADDFKTLYVNLEEPLYQDGPRAALIRNKAFIRIYQFDLKTKKNTAQYAYELEPVALPPLKTGDESMNGSPDILWLGNNRMLVTERSYSAGQNGTNIKVFIADLQDATNIIANPSLKDNPASQAVQKKFLLNMDDLGVYIDNIEGATLGPVLPNGHQSILFVADNNFYKKEQNQFMLFEVIP
ncbi:esterase-like activity of phytase family protein [Pedobacter lusitanus]|uniref:esterase-like activity of phytase family protein n=2 Tax=Pedobacter lusitanus TaxID=1503925 RepID=UPI0032AFE53C